MQQTSLPSLEEAMKLQTFTKKLQGRRHFIGGSDARIILNADAAALVQLWREKRGEAEPEDLSGNLIVQLGIATEVLNRTWYEHNTGRVVIDVQRRVRHPVNRWMAATLGGFVEDVDAVRGQVHAALVVLRRGRGGKAYGPAPAQHVGGERRIGGFVDHHRRRQMV
jgi:predicted phage-related endonuclease